MVTLTNKDINHGVIIYERQNYPEAKFVIEEGVTVNYGDLIQIVGRYTSEGVTEVVADTDGYTVNGTKQFKDNNATFQDDNVAVDDVLWIKEGVHLGFYSVVSIDSQTQITTDATANFTSTTSLTYEIWTATIFKGRIVDKNFEKVKTILCESECESDIDRPIEADFYCGRQGGLIQELLDNECAFITHPFTSSSPYNYRAPHNFRNLANGSLPDQEYFNVHYTTDDAVIQIIATLGDRKKVAELKCNTGGLVFGRHKYDFAGSGQGGAGPSRYHDTLEFSVRAPQTNKNWDITINDVNGSFRTDGGMSSYSGVHLLFASDGNIKYKSGYYDNDSWITIQSYTVDTWYKIKIKYAVWNDEGDGDCDDKWHLWIDDVLKSGAGWDLYGINPYLEHECGRMEEFIITYPGLYQFGTANGTFYFDAYGSIGDNDYILGVNATKEYDQLIYTSEWAKIPMTEKTNRQYFDAYVLKYQKVWYLDADYLIHINDGDVDSLLDIGATTNVDNVDGKKQVKAIDLVVVKGGIVNGIRLTATYGSGNVVAKDTYAHILDQGDLDDMAIQVYNQQSAGILKVALDYEDPDIGLIQVGEEMTIIGNAIRFKKSDDFICSTNTQFKLKSEKLRIGPYGRILYNELYLDDVLLFQLTTEDETQKATEENSQLISEVSGESSAPISGGGTGTGESNLGVNLGEGTGLVYKEKIGVTFNFRSLLKGNGIEITNNANDITLALALIDLLENPPIEDEASKAPTSEWAFDHKANNVANIKHLTDAQVSALHARQHLIESVDDHSAVGLTTGHALRATGATTFAFNEIISNLEYDPALWTQTDVAPSKLQVKNIIVPLTGALVYSGLWTPGTDKYPEAQTDGTAGSTVGTAVFTDTSKNFTSLGVEVGDILNIREGVDLGFYVIDVVGTTTITCTGDTFGTASNLEYQIFRANYGEYWICDADGLYDGVWYEVSDWLIWNVTELQWDRLRNKYGDNVIAVSPGDNIQAAIDEIESIGAGTVFLLSGTHTLTSTLLLNNSTANVNILIDGNGDGSVIVSGDRTTINITYCNSCVLRNFKIDASAITGQTTHIIDVNETNDNKIFVKDVNVIGDSSKLGIGIYTASNNVEVESCVIEQVYNGIEIYGHESIIDRNIVDNCGNDGVIAGGNYLLIINNKIKNCTVSGIRVYAVSETLINSNESYDNNYGLTLETSLDGGITGNIFYSNTSDGIRFISNADRMFISSNSIISNGGWGISIASGCDDNKIGINYYYNNTSGKISNSGTGTILGEGRMALEMFHGGGSATRNTQYIFLSNLGDWISCHFRITDNMDATEDIKIIMSLYKESSGTNPTFDRYLGACKTDASEAFSWNILSASGFDIYQDGVICTRTITIANASIDQGDVVVFYLNQTNAYNSRVYDISIEFTEAQ